ncbi:MAG: hypothetical protein IID46_12400 [Planctomycetes bacterium]|nr:hypothetical protein [Planctomycetota bacterium]
MRYAISIAMLIFVGCHMGTEAIPQVSDVDIPNSQFSVVLYKPDKDDYFYCIFEEHSSTKPYGTTRELGSVHLDEEWTSILQEESPGVYRIVWGSCDKAAYVVIDVKKRLILEDANPDNERNHPLD